MQLLFFLPALVACSADHFADKGRVAQEQGDLSLAREEYGKALDKDEVHAASLIGVGWTWQMEGETDRAEEAFQRCADALPREPECWRGLMSVAVARGDLAAARVHLDKARALAPDDAGVLSSVGMLELLEGNIEAAETAYTRLVELSPDRPEYKMGLAEVRLRQGKAGEAVDLVDEGLAASDVLPRYRGRLLVIKARALCETTEDRLDPRSCPITAPPVLQVLDEADEALAEAGTLEPLDEELPSARRQVQRRREAVDKTCPGASAQPAPEPEGGK